MISDVQYNLQQWVQGTLVFVHCGKLLCLTLSSEMLDLS
jgi:hypothetical protein